MNEVITTVQNVTIILTEEEAERFKKFQKYYDTFMVLINNGVFDVQYGKTTLNFKGGLLENITKEEVIFKR